MKKILLCCCAGMSTSLLVTRMEAEAEKRGLEIKIWACSEKVFEEEFKKVEEALSRETIWESQTTTSIYIQVRFQTLHPLLRRGKKGERVNR